MKTMEFKTKGKKGRRERALERLEIRLEEYKSYIKEPGDLEEEQIKYYQTQSKRMEKEIATLKDRI